ncbi:hypothetical protein KP509_1Z061600 [Ceratopteris richardii]|nr:hypothetical protein KP509_1Z061600 [Ceratopteris richardii]
MVAQNLYYVVHSLSFVPTTRVSCFGGEPLSWPYKKRHFNQQSWLLTRTGANGVRPYLRISAAQETDTQAAPSAAAAAVELGLSLFKKGRVNDALDQFDAALTMNPEPDEAKAALYNKACCHAKREEEELASEALRKALRDYGLKFSVILNDPDLALFRSTQEFRQLQDEARKGRETVGQGFRRDLKLIGEVQAPFRAVRKTFYVVLCAAAGISTVINGPQLFRAIQGGENAPDVLEVAKNLGINLAGIVIFVALFIWDTRKEEQQLIRISRDETLSRLPLRLNSNRVVELVQLRDTFRPIILAGNRDTVMKSVQRAEEQTKKKKGFGNQGTILSASTVPADDFEARAKEIASKTVGDAEKKLKAEVVSPLEWERWIREQQEEEGVERGSDVYIVLRLDGRVRKSGVVIFFCTRTY